jgi:hypothetical protein
MADEQLVVMTKEDAGALRWLMLATAREKDRPVLRCLHLNKEAGLVEAADGFRIHRHLGVPDCMADLEDGLWLVNDGKTTYKEKGRAYPLERLDGTFPDVDAIWPDGTLHAAFSCHPEYVQDAMEMPTNGSYSVVNVKARTYSVPFEVESTDGKCRALIMPVHPAGDLKGVSNAVLDALEHGPVGKWIKQNRPETYRAAVAAMAREAEEQGEVENG